MSILTHSEQIDRDLGELRRAWLIIITGNNQTLARETGGELTWRTCRHLSSRGIATPTPFPWTTDWTALAAFIERNSVQRPRLFVWAHSWGVDSAVEFMRALGKIGLSVELAWFVDGVHRTALLPTWLPLNVLSLTLGRRAGERPPELGGLATIRVPANVGIARAWYQTIDRRVRGHAVVAADPTKTLVLQEEVPGVDHHEIDTDRRLIAHFVQVMEARLSEHPQGAAE